MNKVTLKKLVKELNLEVIYGNSYLERTVTKVDQVLKCIVVILITLKKIVFK